NVHSPAQSLQTPETRDTKPEKVPEYHILTTQIYRQQDDHQGRVLRRDEQRGDFEPSEAGRVRIPTLTHWTKVARAALSLPILLGVAIGVVYEVAVGLGSGEVPRRFAIPYAVPIFDTPFALVAVGIGYLGLERHRLRQDVRSAGMGSTLWLTALLALAHIAAQPDYPANPGVNAGIAPYFFFLSYLAGLAGIGLAAHSGERSLPLRDRGRFAIGAGVVALSAIVVVVVLEVRPLLPSMVRMPGRFTPFGLWSGVFVSAAAGAWALWGGLRRYFARDPFGGYLLLAAYIWMLGLIGVLICPY